jgi:hypothetical protein
LEPTATRPSRWLALLPGLAGDTVREQRGQKSGQAEKAMDRHLGCMEVAIAPPSQSRDVWVVRAASTHARESCDVDEATRWPSLGCAREEARHRFLRPRSPLGAEEIG